MDPDSNLSCGYYEVPMDYFDSFAGKARLALIKFRATVPGKKGTLFVNPGATTGCDSPDEAPHADASQVGLETLASSSCLPWDLRL